MRRNLAATAAALVALPWIAFQGAFGLRRFHDDWTFVFRAYEAVRDSRPWRFVLSPLDQHWSPLWHLVELASFRAVGWERDTLIRSFILLTYVASLLAFLGVARKLGVVPAAAFAGLLCLGLHPTLAAALYSFDTYSQCAADLCSWLAAALVLGPLTRGRMLAAIGLIAVGLLFKEQALAGAAVVLFFLVARHRRDRIAWKGAAGIVLLVAVFALARASAGVETQRTGAFRIAPERVPVNAAQMLGALASPARTLDWFDALRADPPRRGVVAGLAVATVAVVAWIAAGCFLRLRLRDPDRGLFGAVAGALVLSCFPTALLAHVGELYVHTGVFWLAALVALAADGWLAWAAAVPARRVLAGLCILLYAAALGAGLRRNLADMRATGERAAVWLQRIRMALIEVPASGLVVIDADEPDKGPLDYGLYRLTRPQYLVLTGVRPSAVRYVTGDRIDAVLREALTRPDWSEWLAPRLAKGGTFSLRLTQDEARLGMPR